MTTASARTSVPTVAVVGMSGFSAFHRKAVADLAADGAVRHVAQVVPPMDQEAMARRRSMTAARNRSGRHCAVGYQYNCLEPSDS
mgnify:CR=1 FL=1